MITLCELLSEVCQSIMRTLILAKIITLLVSFYTHVVVKAFFHTSEKTMKLRHSSVIHVYSGLTPTELCISVSPAHWLDENTNLPKALNPHNVSNALPNLRFNTPCNKLQDFRSDSNESLFSFLNGQIVC